MDDPSKKPDEKCPGKALAKVKAVIKKFLGQAAPLVPPCKAACESVSLVPEELVMKAAMLVIPLGGRQFGFLSARRCDCLCCNYMRRMGEKN